MAAGEIQRTTPNARSSASADGRSSFPRATRRTPGPRMSPMGADDGYHPRPPCHPRVSRLMLPPLSRPGGRGWTAGKPRRSREHALPTGSRPPSTRTGASLLTSLQPRPPVGIENPTSAPNTQSSAPDVGRLALPGPTRRTPGPRMTPMGADEHHHPRPFVPSAVLFNLPDQHRKRTARLQCHPQPRNLIAPSPPQSTRQPQHAPSRGRGRGEGETSPLPHPGLPMQTEHRTSSAEHRNA
jgi:hypothetical protein